MLAAYCLSDAGLDRLPADADPAAAGWIDLCQPTAEEVAAVRALGLEVPTLEDMEEIEISNRLYRAHGAEYMTVVLPGTGEEGVRVAGPVTFILSPARLVTVRHHAPRSFETYPGRADTITTGCGTPARVFLGLTEEIISRLADLMEGVGRSLDATSRHVFDDGATRRPRKLQTLLTAVGREGELLGRVRLALLSLERALSHFQQTLGAGPEAADPLRTLARGQLRDIQALGVHADFLSGRVTLTIDSTLGMISLAQNDTVRIVSVVAALFLPPTLIASVYGMNFAAMPELGQPWGYPVALGLMLGSALLTYLYFRWRGWM